jgi:alpha-beta hydrolase superfamily lysophospholipase
MTAAPGIADARLDTAGLSLAVDLFRSRTVARLVSRHGQSPIECNREAALHPVVARFPQGRHEVLNEINRAEVVQSLLAWLNGVIDKMRA